MIYLLPTSSKMTSWPEYLGSIMNPDTGISSGVKEGRKWALDNGCFSGVFNEKKFFKLMDKLVPFASTNLFCVLPDVVGNSFRTQELWFKWIGIFKQYPFKMAFVVQDNQKIEDIPKESDCIFLGGTTKYKLSIESWELTRKLKEQNKYIHIGRVNSYKRMERFLFVADSVDGTCMRFQGTSFLVNLDKWQKKLDKLKTIGFWKEKV